MRIRVTSFGSFWVPEMRICSPTTPTSWPASTMSHCSAGPLLSHMKPLLLLLSRLAAACRSPSTSELQATSRRGSEVPAGGPSAGISGDPSSLLSLQESSRVSLDNDLRVPSWRPLTERGTSSDGARRTASCCFCLRRGAQISGHSTTSCVMRDLSLERTLDSLDFVEPDSGAVPCPASAATIRTRCAEAASSPLPSASAVATAESASAQHRPDDRGEDGPSSSSSSCSPA
mmetsp:Transcript_110326/g.313009  ORF Transcript_110326/g.313009 Transcript_110326/m.313009 type:complete len:231 (+) Transcript_110326:1003-1695(+)